MHKVLDFLVSMSVIGFIFSFAYVIGCLIIELGIETMPRFELSGTIAVGTSIGFAAMWICSMLFAEATKNNAD